MAIGAVISCLGALNGLVMLHGQMPFALARDRLFHPRIAKLSNRQIPYAALILSGALITFFIFLNYSRSLVDLFTFIITLSTLSILLPYAFSAMSEIMLLVKQPTTPGIRSRRRSAILAGLAFSLCSLGHWWCRSGSGILGLCLIPFWHARFMFTSNG